jgi:predicted nucleotidyltransferase
MNLFTKNRAELLSLFFTNPDKFFYMQEIGRILNKKPGVFQRTLNNMTSEGILVSEYRANSRYFTVNKNNPIYKELKSIIFKTIGISGSIKQALEELKNLKLAFIYGSYAKNQENYLSDIDIIIIGNPDEEILINKLDSLEKKLQREINYKIYSYNNLEKEITEKEPFIINILEDRKIMLVGSENEIPKISKR